MQFHVVFGHPAELRTDVAIVPVFERAGLSRTASELESAGESWIHSMIRSKGMRGRLGDTLLHTCSDNVSCAHALLVGCGPEAEFDRTHFRTALTAGMRALNRTGLSSAISYLAADGVPGADPYVLARDTTELWHDAAYRYEAAGTDTATEEPSLECLKIAVNTEASRPAAELGIGHGDALGMAANFSRDLCNLPPNVCTPTYLAESARRLAPGHAALTVEILDENHMRKHGMGALLAVTAGASEPAKFVVMQFRGATADQDPVVMIGKGVTFDAGGISLKPAARMDELKYDMSGAAAVMGAMHAVTRLNLPLNLVVLAPCCENLPGGAATRPGDVVRSMSGQTVEILNTDAEGRLILADALTFAHRFDPAVIIDVATLTGACAVALGHHRSGLMSNSEQLARQLLAAGEAAHDPAWQLPLDKAYAKDLESHFADVANFAGLDGGAITAASFLSRFAAPFDWSHLDVAGTAYRAEQRDKCSTGRPVPLLVEFLIGRTRDTVEQAAMEASR